MVVGGDGDQFSLKSAGSVAMLQWVSEQQKLDFSSFLGGRSQGETNLEDWEVSHQDVLWEIPK